MRRGSGRLDVFTFTEGLLSRAGHDLHFRLGELPVTLEGEDVRAELPLDRLLLVGPVEDGVTNPEAYDAGKRAEVERTMREEVLRLGAHPTARFTGRAVASADGFVVKGQLDLQGTSAPLTFAVRSEGGAHRGRFELHPTRWGIAPHRAMLGALRVKDLVRIDLEVRER
jgi:hypothetical protein